MKNNLLYLAGYIDGDGCFFLNKQTNPIKYRASIIISSTCKDILETFKECFGGHVYITTFTKEHWKRSFHWIVRGKFALELTYKIIDFLTEKKGDAFIFMDYLKNLSKPYREELIYKMRAHRKETSEINESVVEKLRSIKARGVTDEFDYPYLSGFIDAECCLGIDKYKPKNRPNYVYKITLQCTNTNPLIFFWLMERFGGSISHVKRRHKNPNHRDQIVWTLTGERLTYLLPKLYPFLRSRKKQVCKKLMEFHKTILPNGGDRHSKEFNDSYEKTLSIREKLVQEIHALNSKGVNNV